MSEVDIHVLSWIDILTCLNKKSKLQKDTVNMLPFVLKQTQSNTMFSVGTHVYMNKFRKV